jgi:shikimate dehydrogenase
VAAAAADGFDLIINASPIGMQADDPLPVDCAGLEANAIVADAIMHPPFTRLLATARERGCFIQPGTFMMDYQIAAMAPFFGHAEGDWSPQAIAQVVAACT